MFYNFPIITNIKQAYEAIEGRDEFIAADRGDHIIFNYNVNFVDTFPEITSELLAVRRELRGLVFDKRGRLLSRPYHKFFNYGERNETLPNNVDLTFPHIMLDKMDGSFIRPYYTGGELRYATKMGLTDVAATAEDFVRKSNVNIHGFSKKMVDDGYTPIFELCSRRHRIVVDYPYERLVLTNVRHMETGEYLHYSKLQELAEEYGLDLVAAFDNYSDIAEFLEHTRTLEDQEGYVIRFDNGHMLKVKAEQYMMFHRSLDNLQREKDVVRLLLADKLDDVKAFLNVDMHPKIDQFHRDFHHNVDTLAEKVYWDIIEAKDNIGESRKRFAMEFVANYKDVPHKVVYNVYERIEEGVSVVKEQILEVIGNNIGSQPKLNSVKYLFGGLDWYDYYIRTTDIDG